MKTNTITAGAVLRLTQESDIALLPAIERSAAQAFRQIPSLAWLADSEVISVARHHDYLETEHSLLAVAVPWNAPFYTRLGFAMLDELTLPAGLAAKREQETRHGLPPESRCAMRLAL